MNIFDATPTPPPQKPSNTDSKALLGQTTNARLNIFQSNGNSWNPAPAPTQPEDDPSSAPALEDATIKGLPSAALNMGKGFLKGVGKFVKSAVSSPYTLATGGKTAQGTYERDAANTASDVIEGKAPLRSALKPIADTVGEGGTILTAADPEIAGAAKSLVEKGAGVASDVVSAADKGIGTFISKLTSGSSLSEEEKATKSALDVVSPKLTKKETEAALAAGRGEGGGLLSKAKIKPDTRTVQVADAVKNIVSSKASGATNINSVREALSTEAESLKSQIKSVDHPYVFKELASKLSNVEEPISIKGTQFEKQISAVKDAAMSISKKNGGTVSSLLDSRKEFDALVSKEYPNLYDKENAPMRTAITAIRNTMNDFIESNLPDDISFKNSLKKQSLYYDAIDNIAGKSTGDIGKTGLQQKVGNFTRKHPIITAGAGLLGAEEIKSGIDRFTGK